MQDSRLVNKLKDVARDAQAIARDIERGQATTPLADHCQQIVDEYAHRAPAIAVLATTAAARREALRWLLGPRPSGAVLRAGSSEGLDEIELEGEGFAVLSAQGLRHEVPDLAGFLGALESGPASSGGRDAIALHDAGDLQGRAGCGLADGSARSLTLLLPSSVHAALEQAGLVSELQARAQLFVLAHDEQAQGLPPELWSQLHQVLAGVMLLWPVSTELPSEATPGRWWRELQALPSSVLQPAAARAEEQASPLRGAVGECLRPWALQAATQRLRQAVEALKERMDHDVAQLQARRGREEEDGRSELLADAQQRHPFDLARLALVDDLSALSKLPAESARRSLLPEGSLSLALGDQLRRLEHADLEHESGAKSIKLTLASVAQGQLVTALRRCLKDEVSRDVAVMVEGLQALQRRLEPAIEAAAGTPVRLAMAAPDSAALWGEISDMVAVDVRYRGEMPRRGFFQRLGEGRKAVFAGLMVISLLGSFAGFSWRGVGLLGVAFLVVFAAAVVLTYRTWQREDAERLDKELERVREQLLTECRRVAGDVQREKLARLAAHVDQIKRQVQLQIDDLQRDRQQREQTHVAAQRERSRRRREQLDRQLREAQNLQGRLGKLVLDVQRLRDDAAAEARETALKHKLLA
jgi:hypothetical protein